MQKQPLAVWVTDTHLMDSTIEANFNVYTQLFDLCDNLGVKTIFHGGDIFTSRKGQTEIVLNAFKNILDLAAERGIKIFAIPGNHDKTSYVSDSSFIDAFNGHSGLTVLEAGSLMSFDTINFHFLPYYDETLMYADKLKSITDRLLETECNVLLTHVGVDGVKNNGHVNVENNVKQDMFDKFHYVLVGHYHDRQVLGANGNIVYTGSAYQANFGEDEHKGCTVLFDDGTYEFIQLDFKPYITIDILPQDVDADLVRMVTEKSSEAKIRIRINEELGDDKKASVVLLESIGVKVEVEKESFSPLDKVGVSQVLFTDGDILSTYDQWAIDRKIENANFGKDLLTEVL